jgi:hypothetical protein
MSSTNSGLAFVPAARVGDSMTCPGCGEKVTLDWADGWRNDNGFTCEPARTTHAQHIFTAEVKR